MYKSFLPGYLFNQFTYICLTKPRSNRTFGPIAFDQGTSPASMKAKLFYPFDQFYHWNIPCVSLDNSYFNGLKISEAIDIIN